MTTPSDPPLQTSSSSGQLVPVSTGSAGAQNPGLASDAVIGQVPKGADHVGAVLGEHIQAGSPTSMAFAVAAFRDAHASRELLSKHLDRTSSDRDAAREQYHSEAKKAAVLEARLDMTSRFKRFQSWAFGVGGVVAGAGLGSALQAGTLRALEAVLVAAGLLIMWIGAPLNSRDAS
jgi:hypothetical protein